MKVWSKAGWGIGLLAMVVACGQVEDDTDVGGKGGDVGTGKGGASASGGSGGSGAVGQGGKVASGGSAGQGGTVGAGGSIGKGGTGAGGSGKGGAPNTGGTASGGTTDGGTAGEGGTGGTGDVVQEGSWDTTLALTVTSSNSGALVTCTKANFTMHLTPSGSGAHMISGRDGDVFVAELVSAQGRDAGVYYAPMGSIALSTRGGDCTIPSMSVTELSLHGYDSDADDVVDVFDGNGKGTAQVIQGDVGVTVQLSFTLKGSPDVTKPTFIVPSSVHPLDGVTVRATEPVVLSSVVSLASGSTTLALTGSDASEGALGMFSSAQILPFGSSWKVNATGTDLASLAFQLPSVPAIPVLADPGVFAQDGFETTPAASLMGSAAVVSAIGNLSAISGSHSLLVPPNSSATLHLARASGTSSVRFTTQLLSSVSGFSGGMLPITVGVVGGTARVKPAFTTSSVAPTATGDTTWAYAGPKQDVALTLTESGSDVVVRIAPLVCQGLCPPSQAILLDDLRVE